MKKTIEIYYCDKCKKQFKEGDTIYNEPYQMWMYELCDDCLKQLKELKSKVDKLKYKWEKLEEEYQFGEYLPKETDEVD